MVKVKYKNFKHSDTAHDNTTVQARHVEAIYEGIAIDQPKPASVFSPAHTGEGESIYNCYTRERTHCGGILHMKGPGVEWVVCKKGWKTLKKSPKKARKHRFERS